MNTVESSFYLPKHMERESTNFRIWTDGLVWYLDRIKPRKSRRHYQSAGRLDRQPSHELFDARVLLLTDAEAHELRRLKTDVTGFYGPKEGLMRPARSANTGHITKIKRGRNRAMLCNRHAR